MNDAAYKQLQKARANMIIDHPFFGTLALRLRLVEDTTIKTLATDGRSIFYNPEFILGMSLDLTKSAVAHEVMHPVLDHIVRRANRDPSKWNRAADYALNPILKDAGFTLGEKWLYNAALAGKSADEIYNMLPPGAEGGGGADGGAGGLCDIRMPSSDGEAIDGNDGVPFASAEDDALDWRMATAQAAHEAQKQGKLPGSLQRFVNEALGYSVHYREILWRFATEISKNDYTWARPNRRWLSAGLYMPRLYSEQMGEMAVVVDTSGSIGDKVLANFGGEISALRAALNPRRLYVIYCDTRVQQVDQFEPGDVFTIKAPGGGGTDFRPPFAWLAAHGIDPACLVYLTDMYGSFPSEPPSYPVLWCATSDIVGPFGETVRVRE